MTSSSFVLAHNPSITAIVRKNTNCVNAIQMGLEQAISQQLLGVRLGAQLERCS
jgi:hypothetical protein